MKNLFIKALSLVLIAILGLSLGSCQNTSKVNKNSEYVTSLMVRKNISGNEKEWETIQALYKKMTEAVDRNRDDNPSKIKLAEIYMNEARITGEHPYYYTAALKMVDNIIASPKVTTDQTYLAKAYKASVLLSLHQFAEAKKIAEEVILLNPNDAGTYGALVDANVELGKYDEAVKMSDKMIAVRPDIRSYSRISYLREIFGEVAGAKESMVLAVQAGYPGQEQTEWARLQLGNLYLNYGSLDTAFNCYQSSLAARPNYAFAVDGLGRVAQRKGNFEEAEKYFKQAIQLMPELSFVANLAMLYKENNKYPEKVTEMKATLLQMMADDEAHGHKMGLEKAHLMLNLYDEPQKALDAAKEELAIRPENIDVNKELACIYAALGDYTKANEHIEIAQKTKSQNPEIMFIDGLLKIKINKTAQGQQQIAAALKANPSLAQSNLWYAKAYASMK